MAKVLIQFAHPALEKSRVHRALLHTLRQATDITFNDLYERYPDFDIDVAYEQQLLEQHDIVVLQHPLYWYSAPALIKQWLDLVLEHGWAYGSKGKALHGKTMVQCVSCGGTALAYSAEGRNKRFVKDYLLPFAQTATLCGMQYADPFIVYGTHKLTNESIDEATKAYANWLQQLTTHPQANVAGLTVT